MVLWEKVLATKPDNLNSIPWACMVERTELYNLFSDTLCHGTPTPTHTNKHIFKKNGCGCWKMAQWLRALAVFRGPGFSFHMAVYNHLCLGIKSSLASANTRHACAQTYMPAKYAYTF